MHCQPEQSDIQIELYPAPYPLDVAETEQTFLGNATLKAQAFSAIAQTRYVLADDSGLIIPALAGWDGIAPFPGVLSNRWLTPERENRLLGNLQAESTPAKTVNQGILNLMEKQPNRQAYYVCALVLFDRDIQQIIFSTEATCPLWVTQNAPRGEQGFGYDPIMHPVIEEHISPQTLAELSPQEKNRISHRGKALQTLYLFLKDLNES